MLGAYDTKGYDSHPIFDKLAIAGTEGYGDNMNCYNVIHIDFSIFPDYCNGYQEYYGNVERGFEGILPGTGKPRIPELEQDAAGYWGNLPVYFR